MSDTKVGTLIPETAQRDAIHIAVAPVVSSGSFLSGEHVGLMPDGRVGTRVEKHIGIIDPFLEHPVREGERCWLFLYPQTVTGIRHHWSHPAFQDQSGDSAEAREWITAFAAKWKHTFDDFMAAARQYVLKDYQLDSEWLNQEGEVTDEDWNKFWEHFRTLTGLSVKDRDKEFVVCCPN